MAILGSIGGGVAKAALGLGVGSAVYGAATREDTPKDPYGYGTEVSAEDSPDYNEVKSLVKASKEALYNAGEIPEKFKQQIMQLNPNDYTSSFFGGGSNDFAYELKMLQDMIQGVPQQRDDGRYQWDGLLLDEGQTPAQHMGQNFPVNEKAGY